MTSKAAAANFLLLLSIVFKFLKNIYIFKKFCYIWVWCPFRDYLAQVRSVPVSFQVKILCSRFQFLSSGVCLVCVRSVLASGRASFLSVCVCVCVCVCLVEPVNHQRDKAEVTVIISRISRVISKY